MLLHLSAEPFDAYDDGSQGQMETFRIDLEEIRMKISRHLRIGNCGLYIDGFSAFV